MVAIQKDAESQIIDKQKIVDFDVFEFTIELLVKNDNQSLLNLYF